MRDLKLCIDLRIPWTEFTTGIAAGFTVLDKWLFSALRQRELMICRCGVDTEIAWNEENASWLDVRVQHCYACEMLERHEKSNNDSSRADIPLLILLPETN